MGFKPKCQSLKSDFSFFFFCMRASKAIGVRSLFNNFLDSVHLVLKVSIVYIVLEYAVHWHDRSHLICFLFQRLLQVLF